jgi:hypothetical protein
MAAQSALASRAIEVTGANRELDLIHAGEALVDLLRRSVRTGMTSA